MDSFFSQLLKTITNNCEEQNCSQIDQIKQIAMDFLGQQLKTITNYLQWIWFGQKWSKIRTDAIILTKKT